MQTLQSDFLGDSMKVEGQKLKLLRTGVSLYQTTGTGRPAPSPLPLLSYKNSFLLLCMEMAALLFLLLRIPYSLTKNTLSTG